MIKRLILSDLQKWAKSKSRKPLVLRGARQVGKTTAVKEFAKDYECFIQLNLETTEHCKIFSSAKNINELVDAIFFISGNKKSKKKTLIFIDEIQNSPDAIKYLRYFYEEYPALHVIAAGSLLESMINKSISFPVGRVSYLAMRPCSFVEFLDAKKENSSIELIVNKKIPVYAHSHLIELFRRYILVGGMPEALAKYIDSGDLLQVNEVYKNLLAGYTDDVEKYANNSSMVQHIRHILRTGFSYAGQRIKFEHFGGSVYRSREMGEAFHALEKAMLLELIYPANTTSAPIVSSYRKSPKLLWLDSGLVNYASGMQNEVFKNAEITASWKGISAEIIVGQELLAYDINVLQKRHFWTREEKNSTAEIDFVIQYKGFIIPIEVKSGAQGSLKSLHLFMDKAPHKIAVRIYSGNFSIENVTTAAGKKFRLFNVPFYLISQINYIIDKYI